MVASDFVAAVAVIVDDGVVAVAVVDETVDFVVGVVSVVLVEVADSRLSTLLALSLSSSCCLSFARLTPTDQIQAQRCPCNIDAVGVRQELNFRVFLLCVY